MRHVFNILVVWTATGFWHGASWNFVLWGLLYAVLLLFEKYILRPQARFSVPMHIYTLLFVMLGFVLFDAASVSDAFMSFKSMFGFAGIPAMNAASLYYLKSNLVLLTVAVVGATPLPKRIYEKIGGTAGGSRVLAVLTPTATVAAIAVCTAYLIDGSFNPFVFFPVLTLQPQTGLTEEYDEEISTDIDSGAVSRVPCGLFRLVPDCARCRRIDG